MISRTRWMAMLIGLLALLALSGCGPLGGSDKQAAEPTPSTSPTKAAQEGSTVPTGRMAFMGPYGPTVQVFVMNADGTGLRLVSDGETDSVFPALSPDGTKVAYSVQEAQNLDLVVTDIESGETTRLTETPDVVEMQPAWSPDGSRIAFMSNRDGTFDIFVMKADGTDVRPLVQLPDSDERMGSWSPDGQRLVFVSETDQEQAIQVVDVESGEVKELSRRAGVEANPTFSPDGTRIAFYSDRARPGEDLDLYVMDVDGSNVQPIKDDPQNLNLFPVWSPDGRWLAYTMPQGERYVVVQMLVEAGLERQVQDIDGVVTSWVASAKPLEETGFSQQDFTYQVSEAVLSQAPSKGKPDAPVVIVEFSDYQCPFCKRFAEETLPALQRYIDEGTVRLVYVDFPIDQIHPQARAAAQAAYCAAEQGGPEAYWQMHDVLFAAQDQWAGKEDVVSVLADLAERAGLDGEALRTCVESGRFAERVQQGLEEGTRLGVSGTPTFFVNGKKLVGAQSIETFEQLIAQFVQGQ